MSLKNIKVTEDVKQQLDDYAMDKETYNVTIQRLIHENNSLKERCDELKQDKELFREIHQMKKRPIRHNPIFEYNDIGILVNEGINEFYRQQYKNDSPEENYASTPLEIVGFISILNALYELDVEYEDDYDKQKLFDLFDNLNHSIRWYKGEDYNGIDYEESLYNILKCDYRDYDVKDDLLQYLKE